MAGVTEAQASVMRRRRSCNVGGGVAYTCPFMCPHKKKSNGVKSGICTRGEKGDPLHYATSCHMTLSYNFTKPSAENTQIWWKSVLSNKLSRIKIAILKSFLTENENLIKQPPNATSSSDSDPDFSPSPRPQTYGLRLFKGSISRTLFSPPISTFGTFRDSFIVLL
ncbi:hypothetical protein AVEN_69990-1 [Araneus ventricosus]|uniref:Uncharacterized protein n=1 Tax=Araneus ventricosus TaxID=182803 RepID=A0A4Y2N4E5_ARAVE|nr:hypothetical protein AVEN_69990-1 [Araneus ventricosus]